ncbi:MAG: hypothetical protein ABI442_07970 [Gemmatimonadaceae bacterium]
MSDAGTRATAGVIASAVRRGNGSELNALALNSHLDSFVYEAMIERKGVFAEITDRNHRLLLACLGNNARISTPYSDDGHRNGWSDYKYHRVFSAAWSLAGTLPADEEWAGVLNILLGKACPLPLKDLETILAGWRIEEDSANPMLSSAFSLRTRLGDLIYGD